MRLKIPFVDRRCQQSGGMPIFDEDTGKRVGQFGFSYPGGRDIRLFDKYYGSFNSHEECVAFADGVAAVLNHMTAFERE
jgi:hypothetical protein